MRIAERAVRSVFVTAGNTPVLWPLLRKRASILMLHRFQTPELGVEGHDPQILRKALSALRRHGYELMSLDAVIRDLAEARPRRRPGVAFTIDDGYLDQALVAAPVFAEFDCPVTTFVATGFLNGELWLWWDQIEYVFEHTTRQSITVPIGDSPFQCELRTTADRRRAIQNFTARCKEMPESTKRDTIHLLAVSADVDLPAVPPMRYAPMTWGDVRRCERMTMTFGPHTVSHPLLSRISDSQSRYELSASWNQLRAQARNPMPVFCYPNGRPQDFSDREAQTLLELGLVAAVTGSTGYAAAADIRGQHFGQYRIRRFAYPDSVDELLVLVSGIERLKQIVRREE